MAEDKLQKIQTQFNALQDNFRNALPYHHMSTPQLESLQNGFDSFQNKIDALHNNLDALHNSFDALLNKLDALEAQVPSQPSNSSIEPISRALQQVVQQGGQQSGALVTQVDSTRLVTQVDSTRTDEHPRVKLPTPPIPFVQSWDKDAISKMNPPQNVPAEPDGNKRKWNEKHQGGRKKQGRGRLYKPDDFDATFDYNSLYESARDEYERNRFAQNRYG